ncbi:MAG: DUF3800 domain-containing protein, partial [candidate division Zixibacteria bacterium]|nr:DUF3800 domain-containing protein [candidate division Zixibacteria bacterium]
MSKFIVYCDESSHTDPQKRNFFAIGSLWIPWEAKPTVNQEIKRIKVDNGLRGEMKWKNVSDLYFKPYADIVDYFFANHDLRFRAILVDQWKVKYSKYHDGDKELGFYKFYYHMLYQWLE